MAIAALPMYDWPEVRPATDALWACLRDRLLKAGFLAPEKLTRDRTPMALWTTPDLIVGQTCGYPFAARLRNRVSLIGTPAYAIGCTPGCYRSIIVARLKHAGRTLAELATARFAFNERESQSGFQAPARLLAASRIAFPRVTLQTGSHRDSIRTVAAGHADFAAIDAVTWEMARAHEPAAAALTVVAETPETPGLPFITARANAAARHKLASAVSDAIDLLDAQSRRALLLNGFVRSDPTDYAPLAEPIEARVGV